VGDDMKKITKKILTVFAVFAAASLMLPQHSLAQGNNMGQRLQQELDMTNDILQRAEDVVRNCGNLRGKQLLNAALEFQNQARQRASDNPVMAYQWTRQARTKALEAIKACQQADENESIVQQQLEQTDRLIERLGESMMTQSDHSFGSVFNSARDNQRRAWEFYRNRQFLPALRLSRQAERTLMKLGERVRTETNNQNRLENQFRQFESNRERVREMLSDCNNDQAFQLARQAEEAYNNAVDFAADGDWARAENAFKMAQKFIREAAELCSQSGSMLRMFEQLQGELERFAPMIRESGNNRAIGLMEEAMGYMERAQKPCQEGENELCAANMRAAQLSLQKAKRLAGI